MGIQGNVNNWRKDMLEVLNHLVSQGAVKVKWETANDEHVCPLCANRNGKIYTISEAKEELKGEFCKPGDPDDRCRCTFGIAELKKESSRSKQHSQTPRTKRKEKYNPVATLIAFLIIVFILFKIFF
jgi:hypothetical protein